MGGRSLAWSGLLLAGLAACGDGPAVDSGPGDVTAPCAPVTVHPDVDGDGYGARDVTIAVCAPPPGWVTRGDDCDDHRADVHPGAAEPDCTDPVDYDCDGAVAYADADGDGHPACTDCDDHDATSFPGAEERCDAVDHDCDGDPHAGAVDAPTWYADADADGHGDAAVSRVACVADGWVANAGDCDDLEPAVLPGAEERCNDVDDDCDGDVDESPVDGWTWYRDLDEDGFGDALATAWACAAPRGFVGEALDCDDRDRTVHPGAADVCNGADDDCSGADDDDPAWWSPFYRDADRDGYGDPGAVALACAAPDAHVANALDCSDAHPTDHPRGQERCDGRDNDCDDVVDEPDAVDAPVWFLDADADGHGRDHVTLAACERPFGFSPLRDDCDDLVAAIHPGAPEDDCADPVDYNCDGSVGFVDADGDSFAACVDCDDRDPTAWPGAPERCDGIDNDCDPDGQIDEDAVDALAWYADADADQYGDPDALIWACHQPAGAVADAGDCDPRQATVHPGAPQLCDGLANDCGDLPTDEVDADHDGWRPCDGDCRDDLAHVHPDAYDACDGADDDCDLAIDEDALGVDPGCPVASCLDVVHANPSAVDGPTWVLPADATEPVQVSCLHTVAGGGWMRCARVEYVAGVSTRTTDARGHTVATSTPGLGSALGAQGTRSLMNSCVGLGGPELGLGVRWTPAAGATRASFWGFDTDLKRDVPFALITPGRQHTCLKVANVSATPLVRGASEPRWLAVGDGHQEVGCRTGVKSQGRAPGLWLATMEAADELWLDLADSKRASAGRWQGGVAAAEDGTLEVWVRLAQVDTLTVPPPPGPAPADVEVLPTRACTSTSTDLRFTESAASLGVDYFAPWVQEVVPATMQRRRHEGGGIAVLDLDGDDDVDLLLTGLWGWPALYLNDGTGRFTEHPSAGFEHIDHVLSAYGVDLDGDGLREVILTNTAGIHVFRNLGGGDFSEEPMLWEAPDASMTSLLSFTDYDGDGLLDIYAGVGAQCFYDAAGGGCREEDELLHGLGGYAFESVGDLLGSATDRSGFSLTGGWIDVDGDGDLDVFVGNDGGSWHIPNRVFLNPGPGRPYASWPEASAATGLAFGMAAMGMAVGDLDRTGETTIVVSDVWAQQAFTGTPGSSAYRTWRITNSYPGTPLMPGGIPASWAVELEDLDHDADLDLVVAWGWLLPDGWWDTSRDRAQIEQSSLPLPNMILSREPGTFRPRPELLADAPASWGYRTAVPADLNGDGTLDLVFSSAMGPVSIQLGSCTPHHWLEVSLAQDVQNSEGLGSLVEVWTDQGSQWRRIGLGNSGSWSAREPAAHFGLAAATVAHLRVTWPDGTVSELGPVAADRRLRVVRRP